jgi:cytochrome oxidase Cu insertion factor (SCO1/SenC/PrrC family)
MVMAALLAAAPSRAMGPGLYGSQGDWLDDQGKPYRLASLSGGYTVLTMAYGACRRVCSTSLNVMQRVQRLADARKVPLNFVVVGLDPSQDKPQDWAEFRNDRKLNRTNWQFISGESGSTRQMAQRLGVRYWRYGEHTVHDFKIVLISPDGELLRSLVAFDEDPASLLP